MAKSKESPIVLELLESKDKVEAIKWLTGATKDVHRNIGEMPNGDSVRFVRHLYSLGAPEVFVVKIGINGKYESTDTLIVKLPVEKAARKAIFDSEAERLEEMGHEQAADVGQIYKLVWFD